MQWYRENPERFEMEKHLLVRHHRGVRIIIKNGKISLQKVFNTPLRQYVVEGYFPNSFPYSCMKVYIIQPHLSSSTPHMFPGGRLCLHGSSNVGPETTAKVYLDWTQQWIRCYEIWLKTKKWPKTN